MIYYGKISASGLTFCYDGSYDDIFYEASFIMDTNWKLGLIGRNGKGKDHTAQAFDGAVFLQGKYQQFGFIRLFSFSNTKGGYGA